MTTMDAAEFVPFIRLPGPKLVVDAAIFGLPGDGGARGLSLLLALRPREPFAGRWALPGRAVRPAESPEEAIGRALALKAGVTLRRLEHLGVHADPGRDPRGPTVSLSYVALVRAGEHPAGDGDEETAWFPVSALPAPLAFDHDPIAAAALTALRRRARPRDPFVLPLLGPEFTAADVHALHETLLGQPLDASVHRRDLLASGLVEPTGRRREGRRHRPAPLLRRRGGEAGPAPTGCGDPVRRGEGGQPDAVGRGRLR